VFADSVRWHQAIFDWDPLDEARARILGRWLLCTERGLFHRPQAGIEIRSDGRWSLLAWASGGGLTTLRGAEAEGTIRVFETGQISFTSDAGRTVGPGGFFGTDPRAMRIDNIAVYLYDYVAAEEVDLGNVEPQ
jgi:hypothetical protein